MSDKVTVIVPLYNSEDYIAQCIRSVTTQTHMNWELIVVDDCSTDSSVDIARRYAKNDPRIIITSLDKNSGNPARPRNKGIEMATGRYLTFLDADDYWFENKLERQLAFMRDKDIGFSFTRIHVVNPDGSHKRHAPATPEKVTFEYYIHNTCITPSTIMIDREKLPDFQFSEGHKRHEDFVTFVKTLKNTDAYGLDEALTHYRRGHPSLSSNKIKAVTTQCFNYAAMASDIGVKSAAKAFVSYARNALGKRVTPPKVKDRTI